MVCVLTQAVATQSQVSRTLKKESSGSRSKTPKQVAVNDGQSVSAIGLKAIASRLEAAVKVGGFCAGKEAAPRLDARWPRSSPSERPMSTSLVQLSLSSTCGSIEVGCEVRFDRVNHADLETNWNESCRIQSDAFVHMFETVFFLHESKLTCGGVAKAKITRSKRQVLKQNHASAGAQFDDGLLCLALCERR